MLRGRLRLLVPADGGHEEVGQLLVRLVDERSGPCCFIQECLPLSQGLVDELLPLAVRRLDQCLGLRRPVLLGLGGDALSLLTCRP